MGSCGSKHCELHHKAISDGQRSDGALIKSQDNPRSFASSAWNASRRSAVDVDVTFHVGQEPDLWKIPAQKQILAKANPVFHAMFLGPWSNQVDNIVVIVDVDARGFENLINYLYEDQIQLRSVPTAVATLHASQKYLCTGLTELCVNYLCEQINSSNVLHVLQHALFYAAQLPTTTTTTTTTATTMDYSPTAPPESALEEPANPADTNDSLTKDQDATNWCNSLVQRCLKYIDDMGSTILASEDFEDLDRETIRLILERDTLGVSCESEVLEALCRWVTCECRRRQLDLSSVNRRNILGDLLWQVRFLAMPAEEFLLGPVASGLLTTEEQKVLTDHRKPAKQLTDLPTYIQTSMPRIATKRSRPLPKRPVPGTENHDPKVKSKKKLTCSKELLKCQGRFDRTNVTEKIFVCLACIFE